MQIYFVIPYLILLGLFATPVSALPDLTSVDWPSPRYFSDRQPEAAMLYGINLFTKSLDGYSASLGVGELEYDESFSLSGNNAGNFNLSEVTFLNGVSVSVPLIQYLPTTNEYVLSIGVRKYRLGLYSTRAIPNGTRKAYSLSKDGRYLLLVDNTPASGETYTLHDTATGTLYYFFWGASSGNPTPVESAILASEYYANFAWNGTNLSNVGLAHAGITVEVLSFDYVGTSLDFISSSMDAARNVKLSYTSDGYLQTVQRGLLPGEVTGIDGYTFTYTFTGSGATLKKVITGIKNLAGKELLQFQLGNVLNGTRTGYTGVRIGPPTLDNTTVPVQPILITYPTAYEVQITSPDSPANPVTLTLHASRGLAIKKKLASCPNPIEELIIIQDGQPHAGAIQEARIRPQCDKLQVKTHIYETNGSLKEVRVNADGQTAITQFTQQMSAPLNGSRLMDVTSITGPDQSVIQLNRDPQGRLRSVSTDSGAVTTGYDYEFYDTAQKILKKIKTYQPNGREDNVSFDTQGRVAETKTAVGSTLEVSTQITYDNLNGRPKYITDPKGNVTTILYKSAKDDRVDSTVTSAYGGSETRRAVYGYSTTFPDTINSERHELTKGGTTIQNTTTYELQASAPLVSRIYASSPAESPVLFGRTEFDPATMRPKKSCGYSKDFTDQSCSVFQYKDGTAGILSGELDKIEVAGGTSAGAFEVRPIYNTQAEVEGETVADQSQSITTKVTYDGFGQVKKVTINPDEPSVKAETEYTYDLAGKVKTQTQKVSDALVSDMRISYDDLEKSDRVSSILDNVSGVTQSFQYNDSSKRLTLAKSVASGTTVLTQLQIASTDYDLYDTPKKATTLIDGVGVATIEGSLNKYGEQEWSKDARGNLTTYIYDYFGRLKSWQHPLKQGTISFDLDLNSQTQIIHNSVENRTNDATLKFPITTDTKISALGNVLESKNQQSGVKNTYTYNNNGQLGTVTTSYEGSSPIVTETYDLSYDVLGRAKEAKHDNSILWQKNASGLGLTTTTKDSRLNPTQVTQDKLGRWKETLYPDNTKDEITARTFYPEGATGPFIQVSSKSRAGDISTTKYNTLGQVTEVAVISNDLGQLIETYEYQNGRLWRKLSDFGGAGSGVTYGAYDIYGRPRQETTILINPTLSFTLGKTYDEQGAIVSHLYPPPVGSSMPLTVRYLRDSYGRIYSITGNLMPVANYYYDGPFLTSSTVLDLATNYSYVGPKALGLLYGVTDSSETTNLSYSYDEKYRLKEKKDLGSRSLTEAFSYTNHDLLNSSVTTKTGVQPYSYTESYGAGLDGILSGIQNPNLDQMFKLPSFSYDARLNPIGSSDGTTYFFNFNYYGMETLQKLSVGSASFSQDAFGRTVWMGVEDTMGYKQNIYMRDQGMILWHGYKLN